MEKYLEISCSPRKVGVETASVGGRREDRRGGKGEGRRRRIGEEASKGAPLKNGVEMRTREIGGSTRRTEDTRDTYLK